MWGNILQGDNASLWRMPDGSLSQEIDPRPKGVLPGSFNPLHEGHRELRAAAEFWLHGPVYYELSVTNVDKPPLDPQVIEVRVRQFDAHPICITSAPTFVAKAQLLPQVTFIVGADTALRIVESRYYGGSESTLKAALETIRQTGCRFLVAGRLFQGRFLTASNIGIPEGYEDLFDPLPEAQFRRDVSSTDLRGSE
jgi:hypothetical protein